MDTTILVHDFDRQTSVQMREQGRLGNKNWGSESEIYFMLVYQGNI